MKEQRLKKKVTTYFEKDDLQKMDSFCKEHNLKRTEFLKQALNGHIFSIEEGLNLLVFAYYSPSDCNWFKLKIDDFLSDVWDVCFFDYEEILNKVLQEENIEWHEYPIMIEKYGFEKIISILMKFVSAQNNLIRIKRNKL